MNNFLLKAHPFSIYFPWAVYKHDRRTEKPKRKNNLSILVYAWISDQVSRVFMYYHSSGSGDFSKVFTIDGHGGHADNAKQANARPVNVGRYGKFGKDYIIIPIFIGFEEIREVNILEISLFFIGHNKYDGPNGSLSISILLHNSELWIPNSEFRIMTSEICTMSFGIRNCEVHVMWASGSH